MVQLRGLREVGCWCSIGYLFVLEVGELRLGREIWLGLVGVEIGAQRQTQQ